MNKKAALYTGLCLSIPFLICLMAVFCPAVIGMIVVVCGVVIVLGVIVGLFVTAAIDLYDYFNERSK